MAEGQTSHGPLVLSASLGRITDQPWHDRAHAAEAAGTLEVVRIARVDSPRRRMRVTTDKGRDVALSLPRDSGLEDGAVLMFQSDLMIVARIDGGPRLRLTPTDPASALRLGYFCGNLHWKADFRDAGIEIYMDGPEDTYRARLVDAEKLCEFTVERREAEE